MPLPSQANSAGTSSRVADPGRVNDKFHRPWGLLRRGSEIASPPSPTSVVFTLNRAPDSAFAISTSICTGTRELRRRSLFIKARAARKLDFARSAETGLYRMKCAPMSKADRSPVSGSRIATATARLLHGAVRAPRSTSAAPGPAQSTMIASYRSRVRWRKAASACAQCSTPMSRSPRVRRSTRTILSSEHSNNDFKVIARP